MKKSTKERQRSHQQKKEKEPTTPKRSQKKPTGKSGRKRKDQPGDDDIVKNGSQLLEQSAEQIHNNSVDVLQHENEEETAPSSTSAEEIAGHHHHREVFRRHSSVYDDPEQLSEARDSVIITQPSNRTLPLWKTYRWKAWAIKKGLIPDDDGCFKKVKEKIPSVLTHIGYDGLSKGSALEIGLEEAGEYELENEEAGQWRVPPNSAVLMYLNDWAFEGEHEGEDDYNSVMLHRMPDSDHVGICFDIEKLAPTFNPKFGSCFTITRNSRMVSHVEDEIDEMPGETETETRKVVEISGYHDTSNKNDVTITFQRMKTIKVVPSRANDIDGFHNGFYLFTDSWIDQELMFSMEILPSYAMKRFTNGSLDIGPVRRPSGDDQLDESISRNKSNADLNISFGFYFEPWDWRVDKTIEVPMLCATSQQSFSLPFKLPSGRNTFRLWLVADYQEVSVEGITSYENVETIRKLVDNFNQLQLAQCTLSVISKSPIHIGSRVEMQNYLTNEPVLFLKQCEIFAHTIWSLLASFGKAPVVYSQELRELRQSYCPSFDKFNRINKVLKKVHDSFEQQFLEIIQLMNRTTLDPWQILAIRCLLLNTQIGKGYSNPTNAHKHASTSARMSVDIEQLVQKYKKLRNADNALKKIITIQRYFRGWQVRRLIQCRRKKHKNFFHVKHEIWKIAVLIAKHSDSSFTHMADGVDFVKKVLGIKKKLPEPKKDGGCDPKPHENEDEEEEEDETELVLLPTPPRWTVDLLKKLIEEHPMLLTVHSHAYCASSHIKIKSIEGIIPQFKKDIEWLPFCRFHLFLPRQTDQWVYCELDLQLNHRDGIIMKVVNNDSHNILPASSATMFLGRLPVNLFGYTVLLYRSTGPAKQPVSLTTLSHKWELRLLSPQIQKSILLADRADGEELAEPRKLIINRFTDYYYPSRDRCMCRYIVETPDLVSYLSLRFSPSNPLAQINLEIVDLNQGTVVFEHKSVGAFILPSVRLEGRVFFNNGDGRDSQGVREMAGARENRSFTKPSSMFALESERTSNFALNSRSHTGISSIHDRVSESHMSINPSRVISVASEPLIQHKSYIQTQRFQISIYVKETTWILSEEEWDVSQAEKEKFWKQFMVKRKAPPTPRHLREQLEAELAESKQAEFNEPTQPESHVFVQTVVGGTSEKGKPKTADESSSKGKAPKKTKGKGKKVKSAKTSQSDINPVHPTQPTRSRRSFSHGHVEGKSPAAASLHPQHPKPRHSKGERLIKAERSKSKAAIKKMKRSKFRTDQNVSRDYEFDEDLTEEEEEFKARDYESSNLLVKTGGSHSVKVKAPRQPSWTFEVLTYADQKISIKSNRTLFKRNLKERKAEWKAEQEDRLRHGLSSLHQNLVAIAPGSYVLSDPFVFVKLMINLDTTPYQAEADFDRFSYGKGRNIVPIQLLIKAEDIPKEELLKRTIPKEEMPQLHPSVLKTKGINKHGTNCPPPTPENILKIKTSEERVAMKLYPNHFAGSDFDLKKRQDVSILPVDLSSGTPSFLAFAREHVPKYFSDTSSTQLLSTREQEELDDEYGAKLREEYMRLYEECRGENMEFYGESQQDLLQDQDLSFGSAAETKIIESNHVDEGTDDRKGSKGSHLFHLGRKCTKLFGVSRNSRNANMRKSSNSKNSELGGDTTSSPKAQMTQ